MQSLYIDLASHQGILACIDDVHVIASIAVDRRVDDAAFVGLTEQTLKKAGWSYKDLTHLACVIGPGGFTSLRVGVAAANAMADALGIPLCGIHLSDLYAARLGEENGKRKTESINPLFSFHFPLSTSAWLHSTKKHELFIKGPDFPEATCITIDDLQSHLQPNMQWMGELIPEQQEIVTKAGLTAAELRPLEEVLPSFLAKQKYKKQILQPWYGRGW